VYCEKRTEHIITLCGQVHRIRKLEQVVHTLITTVFRRLNKERLKVFRNKDKNRNDIETVPSTYLPHNLLP